MTALAIPVDLIEIGCQVWTLDLNQQTDADTDQVKGGTVVDIATDIDEETGEIDRRFITATPWQRRIRFDTVNANEVRQAGPPNMASIRNLIRISAGLVADSKRIGTDQARLIALQQKLLEVS